MSWGDSFAEGDSGVPLAGEATRKWQQIYEAKLEAEAQPMKVKLASAAQIQAKLVTTFMDEDKKVADRLKAIELAMRISDQFAEELALEEKKLSGGRLD